MENDIKIRLAEIRDAARIAELLKYIAELHSEICPHIFRGGDISKYDEAGVVSLITDPENVIFVAESDGTVLGYTISKLKSVKDHAIMRDRNIYYVDDLCIDKNMQHRGIGGLLMDTCIADARARGCDTVELNVWENNEGAKRFYEKYGMKTQRRQLEMQL